MNTDFPLNIAAIENSVNNIIQFKPTKKNVSCMYNALPINNKCDNTKIAVNFLISKNWDWSSFTIKLKFIVHFYWSKHSNSIYSIWQLE